MIIQDSPLVGLFYRQIGICASYTRFYRVPARTAVNAGLSSFQPCYLRKEKIMAINNKRKQRKHIRSVGSYSSEELSSLTMNDGTTVVYSVGGGLKTPNLGSILVKKNIKI